MRRPRRKIRGVVFRLEYGYTAHFGRGLAARTRDERKIQRGYEKSTIHEGDFSYGAESRSLKNLWSESSGIVKVRCWFVGG
jgi:hypothetical protein